MWNMVHVLQNARLHDSLTTRNHIELNLINYRANPNSIKSHTPNVIEARFQCGPCSTAIHVERKRERGHEGTWIICGACETISQYLIYCASGPFWRICSVAKRDDGEQQQSAKHESEVFHFFEMAFHRNEFSDTDVSQYVRYQTWMWPPIFIKS